MRPSAEPSRLSSVAMSQNPPEKFMDERPVWIADGADYSTHGAPGRKREAGRSGGEMSGAARARAAPLALPGRRLLSPRVAVRLDRLVALGRDEEEERAAVRDQLFVDAPGERAVEVARRHPD